MGAADLSVVNGSADAHRLEIGSVWVSDLTFPPGLVLASHFHERPCFAVVLEGSVEKRFERSSLVVEASGAVTMPAEERHRDRFERRGAHILVVEPEATLGEPVGACAAVFDRVHRFDHPAITTLAWRIRRELIAPDAVSPLAIQGLMLEMLATAARLDSRRERGRPTPAWIATAQAYLRARFGERILVSDVAAAVGVEPWRLARDFRRYCGHSIGAHQRRLRLEWAAAQLIASELSLCDIALQAGFADQSHFTRAFRRHTGMSPGLYRETTRS